jgi:hypothetical protein
MHKKTSLCTLKFSEEKMTVLHENDLIDVCTETHFYRSDHYVPLRLPEGGSFIIVSVNLLFPITQSMTSTTNATLKVTEAKDGAYGLIITFEIGKLARVWFVIESECNES